MTHDYRSEWEDLKEVLTAAHAVIEEIEGENGDTDTWWDLPTGIRTLGNRIEQLEAVLREAQDRLEEGRPDAALDFLRRMKLTPEGGAEDIRRTRQRPEGGWSDLGMGEVNVAVDQGGIHEDADGGAEGK